MTERACRAGLLRGPDSARPAACHRPTRGAGSTPTHRCPRSGYGHWPGTRSRRNIACARDRFRGSAWRKIIKRPPSGRAQGVNRKILLLVDPHRQRLPAGAAGKRNERVRRILVAVLGVDRLAGAEIDHLARDPHLLPLDARKMHLDTMPLAIVEGMMFEARRIELAAELAIYPVQEIEIEFLRHALLVVIGGIQHVRTFFQIGTDDQHRAAAEDAPGLLQERARFVRLEIADGRTGKETDV